jgi:hypothetical protein
MPYKHSEKSRYFRERVENPKKFHPESLRIIDVGRKNYTKIIVGCPKKEWNPIAGKCMVGTKVQSILKSKIK